MRLPPFLAVRLRFFVWSSTFCVGAVLLLVAGSAAYRGLHDALSGKGDTTSAVASTLLLVLLYNGALLLVTTAVRLRDAALDLWDDLWSGPAPKEGG